MLVVSRGGGGGGWVRRGGGSEVECIYLMINHIPGTWLSRLSQSDSLHDNSTAKCGDQIWRRAGKEEQKWQLLSSHESQQTRDFGPRLG